jgi:ABC-type uncharacterized transport system substrate-binding protein
MSHPHEWVDVASEVLFDAQGRVTAVRHHWRFDEAFSAFAVQGLDTDSDGLYSAEELAPLAQENVESLKDSTSSRSSRRAITAPASARRATTRWTATRTG